MAGIMDTQAATSRHPKPPVGRFYRWRTAPGWGRYHLVRHGTSASYCGRRSDTWSAYAVTFSWQRCAVCVREATARHHIVSAEGSYCRRQGTDSRPLLQHIHAMTECDGVWSSHRWTFRTQKGFEQWARDRQWRGFTVQWRWCDADDETVFPGSRNRVRVCDGRSSEQRIDVEAGHEGRS